MSACHLNLFLDCILSLPCLAGNVQNNEPNINDVQGTEVPPNSVDYSSTVKVKVYLDEKKEQQMANIMKLAAAGVNLATEEEENEDNDPMLVAQTYSHVRKASSSPGLELCWNYMLEFNVLKDFHGQKSPAIIQDVDK